MWTCSRVEQPRHRAHCKHHCYSYYSLPGNKNHQDGGVLHGGLHAKQQFMHLPRLKKKENIYQKRMQTSVKAARLFIWQKFKMLYNIRTFTKYSKTSICSYKNRPGGGGGGFIHSSLTVSPPSCCLQGGSASIGQCCVFVCFSHPLKIPLNTICSATVGPACTAHAKGATVSIFRHLRWDDPPPEEPGSEWVSVPGD